MRDTKNFLITNIIKSTPPRASFVKIKNKVLGKKYELSLVFIGRAKSSTLNKKYRKKDRPADVLSFQLSKTEGEIFICPETARQNAKKFKMKEDKFITYLFIHGLLHLKGLKHGVNMEKEESKLIKKLIVT